MNVRILDCTMRDGGHLNKWKFNPLNVKASYYAALKSGIDYFEIGYRFPVTTKGLGDFGYCKDDFLFSLFKASDKCKLVVMIDAGKCDSNLFQECKKENTPLQGVRVAAYPYELEKAIGLVEDLKDKAYEVFLNLMAASELTGDQYRTLASWKNKNILNAVYFADSFGSFMPSDIPEYLNKLKDTGFERIGFHPHNSLQLAFANTLRAIEEGVSYVDASILGMGRGAGNLPIEVLVGYLEKKGIAKYNTVAYLDVIERFYLDLYKELDWGYKLQSFLVGLKNVHPYYVNDLFNRRNYTIAEIWNALEIIKDKCPISYSVDKLNEALENRFYTPLTKERVQAVYQEINDQLKIIPAADAFQVGGLALQNKYQGRKFIVIANGPSIVKYKREIERLIKVDDCITIGVNYLQDTFIPDYHMFVSRKRFLKYVSYINENSILLIPSSFGKEIVEENYSGEPYYFDLQLVNSPDFLPVEGTTQQCVSLNVAVSAILMAYQMGASEIFAVGMDGYADEMNKKMVYFYNENDVPDDKEVASMRYEMLAQELDRINRFLQERAVPFSIVTPTSHKKYYRHLFD